MSGHAIIDLSAATPTIPADSLTWPIADEVESAWVCGFCGRRRVYEGGRASGPSDRNDCQECGCRLAVVPETLGAIAKSEAKRVRVRALIERGLF